MSCTLSRNTYLTLPILPYEPPEGRDIAKQVINGGHFQHTLERAYPRDMPIPDYQEFGKAVAVFEAPLRASPTRPLFHIYADPQESNPSLDQNPTRKASPCTICENIQRTSLLTASSYRMANSDNY